MGYEITKRSWDQVLERLTKLEAAVRKIETKFDLIEKKLKPPELYRVVKQQEHEEATAAEQKPRV